jgi:hypothetical protein
METVSLYKQKVGDVLSGTLSHMIIVTQVKAPRYQE